LGLYFIIIHPTVYLLYFILVLAFLSAVTVLWYNPNLTSDTPTSDNNNNPCYQYSWTWMFVWIKGCGEWVGVRLTL